MSGETELVKAFEVRRDMHLHDCTSHGEISEFAEFSVSVQEGLKKDVT